MPKPIVEDFADIRERMTALRSVPIPIAYGESRVPVLLKTQIVFLRDGRAVVEEHYGA